MEFELDHTNLQIQKHSTANKLGKMAGLSIKINRLLLTEKMNGMFHPEPLCSIKFNTLVLNPENSKQFSRHSRQASTILLVLRLESTFGVQIVEKKQFAKATT